MGVEGESQTTVQLLQELAQEPFNWLDYAGFLKYNDSWSSLSTSATVG